MQNSPSCGILPVVALAHVEHSGRALVSGRVRQSLYLDEPRRREVTAHNRVAHGRRAHAQSRRNHLAPESVSEIGCCCHG